MATIIDLDCAGPTEVADRLGVWKSTACHHLVTLGGAGFCRPIRRSVFAQYAFSDIGGSIRDRVSIYQEGHEELQTLATETGECVNLVVEERGVDYIIEKCWGNQSTTTSSRIGQSVPLYSRGTGKAILASSPDYRVGPILSHTYSKICEFRTNETLTSESALHRELEIFRNREFAVLTGEHFEGAGAVATPLRDRTSGIQAAVSVTGPLSWMLARESGNKYGWVSQKLADCVVETANRIKVRIQMISDQCPGDKCLALENKSKQNPLPEEGPLDRCRETDFRRCIRRTRDYSVSICVVLWLRKVFQRVLRLACVSEVITVSGSIPNHELGVTLPHEHLIVDTSTWVDSGPDADLSALQRKKLHEEISPENLWWISTYGRQWDWNCIDNRRLDDESTAIEESNRFVAEGGRTIVDVTPMSSGLGRDPAALRRISNQTGLNVVAGTGHYVRAEHPPRVESQSAEEIAEEMTDELVSGIGDTTVRAGVIGEIGASHPFEDHPNEQKVFRAAAIAQQETGAPITVHPPVMHQEGHEVLDVLEDAGADLGNVILGHLDGALETTGVSEYYDSIANRGVYLEFDTFGRIGYNASSDQCFPLDETRIRELRRLMEAGYGDQLLISHDICKKNQLTRYAGFGYDYILRDIVPRMCRRGFTEDEIESILERNPARALAVE